MQATSTSVRERVVVVTEYWKGWRWFESEFPEVEFHFFHNTPLDISGVVAEQAARAHGVFKAVLAAQRLRARVLIAHGPEHAALCALFGRALGLRVPILGYSFNFSFIPGPLKRRFFRRTLPAVDRFVVFSSMERLLYARMFRLPLSRFEMVHWSAGVPTISEGRVQHGDYICAVGGNARDYPTLLKASEQLPDIPLVIVARPESVHGLHVPPHVRVHLNLPLEQANNVLAHSRFMVLPLAGSEVPCGHVTLVTAMHQGRPFIVTGSSGVADYIVEGENALVCPPFDANALAQTIRDLWENPARVEALGRGARAFGDLYCSERRAIAYLRENLVRYGALAGPQQHEARPMADSLVPG